VPVTADIDESSLLLSIGQLARRAGLTTKALRHYHRLGLLVPSEVHPVHGHRFYSASAVRTARLIAGLRSVDVPLVAVRECLEAGPDQQTVVRDVLLRHRQRLDARVTRLRGDLHRLDHLLSEGEPLMALTQTQDTPVQPSADERRLAVDLFNGVWRLLEQEDRTTLDDDRMLHMAHASRYHWEAVGTAANLARGEWQCSRVYAVLGRSEPSLHHARRVLEICQSEQIGDWDLAFGYEALARAHAVAGDFGAAREATELALAAAEEIADDEDRTLLLADLETIPGQSRFW
jgi:DNA-binding transcriptional MerR regulator